MSESYSVFSINSLPFSNHIFAFEPLQKVHLSVYKLARVKVSERLRSAVLFAAFYPENSTWSFQYIRCTILKHFNSIFAAIEKHYPATGLHIGFSKSENCQAINGSFTTEGRRGMLESKDDPAFDLVFPFICVFWTGAARIPNLSHHFRLHLVQWSISFLHATQLHRRMVRRFNGRFAHSEKQPKPYFDHVICLTLAHSSSIFVHIFEDIRRYIDFYFINAGILEHAHLLFKSHYSRNSTRGSITFNVTITALDCSTATKVWIHLPVDPSTLLTPFTPPSWHLIPPRKRSFLRDGTKDSFNDMYTDTNYPVSWEATSTLKNCFLQTRSPL